MMTCRAGTGRIGTRVGWMKACRVKRVSAPNASGCSTITYEPASIALGHAVVLAVDGRRQVDRLEAGAVRARVTVDHPDDLRAIASGAVERADHEANLLAGRRR